MLCTVLGIGRFLDKDRVEKCALYVAYAKEGVDGQATRALILKSSIVDRSIAPNDVIQVFLDFNGNVDSIVLA